MLCAASADVGFVVATALCSPDAARECVALSSSNFDENVVEY